MNSERARTSREDVRRRCGPRALPRVRGFILALVTGVVLGTGPAAGSLEAQKSPATGTNSADPSRHAEGKRAAPAEPCAGEFRDTAAKRGERGARGDSPPRDLATPARTVGDAPQPETADPSGSTTETTVTPAQERVLELIGGLRLRAPSDRVIDGPNGCTLTGALVIESPLGDLPIAESELHLEIAPGSSVSAPVYQRVTGLAQVPPPLSGGYVSIGSPALAMVGYDLGEEIELGVPLQPDRHYLYFHFDAGLTVEFGVTGDADDTRPVALNIPYGASATMIIDPLDPFYYLSGALSLPGQGDDSDSGAGSDDGSEGGSPSSSNPEGASRSGDEGSEAESESSPETDPSGEEEGGEEEEEEGGPGFGIGRSLHGNIPFRPRSTWGIESRVDGFDGHHLYTGAVPIGKLPLEIDGHVVVRLDLADEESGVDPLGFGFGPSFALGANGTLSVGFGELLSFGFELGDATVGVEVFEDEQCAYFSGVLEPDLSWVPDFVPLVPRNSLKVAGYVSDVGTDAMVALEGVYSLDAAGFASITGLEIDDLLTVTGTMTVDQEGFLLRGTTTSDLGCLDFRGEVEVEMWIAADPAESHIVLAGLVGVSGTDVSGSVTFRPTVIALEGRVASHDLDLALEAAISATDTGPMLVGHVHTNLSLQALVEDDLVAISEGAQQEAAEAMAELEAAAADYEFELSLRGMRGAIPKICDRAIAQLRKVPGKVSKRWPKKWGVRLPGRGAAVRHAKRQIAPHIQRLSRLRDICRNGSDEQVRTALRSALVQLQKHRRVKIRVKRVGTVYSTDLLSGGRAAKIAQAIAAVDSLPAISDRMVSAQAVIGRSGANEAVDQIAEGIRNGVAEWIPTIDSIAFEVPANFGGIGFALAVTYTLGGNEHVIGLSVDSLEELPGAVAAAVAESAGSLP